MAERKQLTSLLSNQLIDRLDRLRLNFGDRFTNRSRGGHLAHKGGQSTEYADFRDYTEGDDTRFIDWNSFARLQRPYIKQFHHEEISHVLLIVDASNSMLLEGKLDCAKELAAAFGQLALKGTERLSIQVLQDEPAMLPPCEGRSGVAKMLRFVEGIKGGGRRPLEEAIEIAMRQHMGRGAAIILSDFLTFGDVKRCANLLFSGGMEVHGIQILGPTEIDPELTGDIRMVDSESEEVLDVSSAGDLIAIYHEHLNSYRENIANLCRSRAGRFESVASTDPLEDILFDRLRRKGWVR